MSLFDDEIRPEAVNQMNEERYRAAEEALFASEELNRRVLNALPEHICVIDAGGVIVAVNDEWTHFAAANEANGSLSVAIGANYLEVCRQASATNDSDAVKALDGIRSVLAGSVPKFSMEYPCHAPHEQRWFLMMVAPFGVGSNLRAVIAHIDITDRKRTEAALGESEARYRMLHESMHDAYVRVKMDGRIIEFNDHYLRMLGYSPDELRMLTYQDLTPEQWHAAEDQIVREQVIPRGYSEVYEKEYRRKDGTLLPVELRTVLLRDEKGRPSEMWGIIRDITERKRVEKALVQLNETLEKKVRERTAMAEAKAIELRSLAVELIETEERERRKFAHLLHDDLQQMLASAKMQLQAVSDRMPHVSALVDIDLLLRESIEKSRLLSHELSPPVLQHSGLVGSLRWLQSKIGEQFNLKVDFEVIGEPEIENPTLKRFLFRSVQELLFNTVKHSGVNHARLVLSGSDLEIRMSVMDEGQGFDPNILKDVKTGFGLLTIRERTSYIGGSFEINSAPGKGSRFTITIPLDQTISHKTPFEIPAALQPVQTGASNSGTTRVLFADDHHIMRKGLVNLVKGKPHIEVVGEASNGQEALEQTLHLRPDVVVMDISMPVMDGIEATRRIKAELPEVRIIGLSMHMDEQTVASMQRAGAEAFFTKTTSPKELLQAIYGPPLDKGPQAGNR
jgi:PAS domain S-box-containing protein